jgi:asparagine synthase (glutamine-hydrolysing)
VPLGAFLSGGLDSSAVVAAMAKHSPGRVRTFTIGFNEHAHDESSDARRVAQHFGTDHTDLIARVEGLDLLPQIVWCMDEPMADSSALPTYLVSHLARQHVTVALSGDGGDELLGGYTRYFPGPRDRSFQYVPALVRKGMAKAANYFPYWMPAKRYLKYISQDTLSRYLYRLGITAGENVSDLVSPDLLDAAACYNPLTHLHSADLFTTSEETVRRFSYLDYCVYLPNDILVKVDRMSMASALEVRSPFLDQHLVELVATFPEDYRSRPAETKRILRAIVGPQLPPGTLDKPKHGFSMPVGSWFRNQLSSYLEEVLLDRRTLGRGLFREAAVRKLLFEHRNGRASHAGLLWALLCLEIWQRKFLDERLRT